MKLLDVVIGNYLPSLFGWLFLVFVLAAESLLLSKYLAKTWVNKRIFLTVIISNIITTIIGFFMFDQEGGTSVHLLSWIPTEYYGGHLLIKSMISMFIFSFILSVIIEAIFNLLMLKKDYRKKKIMLGTTWVNLFTYAVGGLIIFLFTLYDYNT